MATHQLVRRGLNLEYATLAWNIVGTALVLFAAVQSGSIALAGFGFDSLVEVGASAVVIWQLHGTTDGRDRAALRFIGFAFLALAVYIAAQMIYALASASRPEESWLGITWLSATVMVMLALAFGKHRTGKALGNRVLTTEARVTLIDAMLAAVVLLGLVLNAALGWWWADSLAALAIVVYALREARLTLAVTVRASCGCD